jgi:hypothetical protein
MTEIATVQRGLLATGDPCRLQREPRVLGVPARCVAGRPLGPGCGVASNGGDPGFGVGLLGRSFPAGVTIGASP